MEVMISVNPPFSDMIFSGYRPYDYRKHILKGMDESYPLEDIKAYIYETKNKGGKGAVIGEVMILGVYALYYEKDIKPTTELIKDRFECCKTLYLHWCYMQGIKPNMNEGWFKSKKFTAYEKAIGYNQKDFNYVLILDSPKLYATPKQITAYINFHGKPLDRPPRNMVRIKTAVLN